jgi:signal transduction histidine kinase
MFKSIRSRLALSFAAIALVAAVALGAVLLAILQSYYSNLELEYLRGNAQSIGDVVMIMLSGNAPHDEVQSQIENLAFLSQTRIQVYSPDGQPLYDSGSPQNAKINLGVMKQTLIQTNGVPSKDMVFMSIGDSAGETLPPLDTMPIPKPASGSKPILVYRVQAGGTAFGFTLKLNGETVPVSARSNLKVTEIVRDPQNNSELGSVQLSEGPAYGSAIIKSVALGWAIASAIAVLLAAAIGWYISRRISAPVLALTDVTARMAQGDLSSRAGVKSRDEFGQLARSFNEMADQVEGTVAALRRFVSDAAHELHTPLTALRANLDLAAQENDAAAQHVFVERAQATVVRLETLTNNLLDLSRLEAQSDQEPAGSMDLAALVKQNAEVYASQAEQAGLTFAVRVPDEPTRIRADAKQVQRALNNLFDNACKFTPPGGTVAIQLQREDGHVQLSVTDTGIGIPPDDLPQLFNRFHRGRNATAYSGSGLGLAIVKAITEQQGGQIVVENTTPGARFTLQWDALP